MSIYHYFPSKAHLLDAVIDHVIGEFATRPPGADPIARLRQMMYSFRALAHRYPRLFQLLATHRLNTPTGVRVIDEVLELVHAAVPDDRLAAQWFRVLSYYVTGAALDETAGYAKGPSAAVPVSDAYIAEHCPQLAAAAPVLQVDVVGQHVRARPRKPARGAADRAACSGVRTAASRAEARHPPEALSSRAWSQCAATS